MNPIALTLSDRDNINRNGYLIEQGIPVMGLPVHKVAGLRLTSDGKVQPAEIQVEGKDASGAARWVMVTAALDLPAGKSREFALEMLPDKPAQMPELRIEQGDQRIVVQSNELSLELSGEDHISLSYKGGELIDGPLAFSLMHDARTFVSGVRTMHLIPAGFTIEERSESRCLILWRARMHPDVYREYSGINPKVYFDCELEIRVYAASPTVRLKWTITNQFGYPAALERYALALPISPESLVSGQDWDGAKFGAAAVVESPGGRFAVTAPFIEDIGKGAGIGIERLEWIYDERDGFSIESTTPDELPYTGDGTKPGAKFNSATRPPVTRMDWRITVGGIDPPADEGAGTDNPQIHRTLLHGMSRTFESAIIPNPTDEAIAAELAPIYFTASAQHYSDTWALPERGDRVTFGEFEQETVRSAAWMLKNQWRDSLYFGEWWREYDVVRKQGIEEAGSGNSALGVFYHYLRTGDPDYLAASKRSMTAIFDLTMNKQTNGMGPFVHTRRFLFDRENWHHPRYQRVGGIIRPSHVFCDRRMRMQAVETVRWFAEHFVDTDGAPLNPQTRDADGPKSRCDEAAMSQFCESMILAYHETGDEFFLEKAKLMANWAVDQMEAAEDLLVWLGNWNIQFVQRGLLAVYLTTGETKLRDAYVKICRNILRIKPEHAGYRDLVLWETHFVVYFAWHFAEAHKMTGDDDLLREFLVVLNSELERQVEDGTYPYVTMFSPRLSEWISYYDPKSTSAYLPVLAARMEEANIGRHGG